MTNLAWLQKVNEGVLQVPLHLQLLNESPPAARKPEHLTRSATEVALWVLLPWQGKLVKEWAYGRSSVKVMQTPFSSGTHLVKQLPERQICLRVLKKLRQQQRSHNDKLGFCLRCVNPAWSAAVLVLPCQSSQCSQEDSVCIPQRYLQPREPAHERRDPQCSPSAGF